VNEMGRLLMEGLAKLQAAHPDKIKDVRGVGLMIGLEPVGDARALAAALLERGLVTSPTVTNVIRLVPPLIIDESHVAQALGVIGDAIAA